MTIKEHVIAFLILAASCGTPLAACDTIPAAVWPSVAHCGSEAAGDLLPEVSAILLDDSGDSMSDGARGDLERLAVREGAEVVACLVGEIVDRWASKTATSTPERTSAIARVRGWQADVGTRVVR